MNKTETRPIDSYLRQLDWSMRDLPAARRDEILDEVAEHIDESLAEIESPTDADVRNVLDRVGDPDDIAAEARERFGLKVPRRRWTDIAAIVLMFVGGFTGVGWIPGLIFLWVSDVWKVRDKVIGSLVVPLSFAAIFLVNVPVAMEFCSGTGHGALNCTTEPAASPSVVTIVTTLLPLTLIGSIAVSIYLAYRLVRRSARSAPTD